MTTAPKIIKPGFYLAHRRFLMNDANIRKSGTSISILPPVPKWRWAVTLILGTILWYTALFASEIIPQVFLGLELQGPTYALAGVIRAVMGYIAIKTALRPVHLKLSDIGLNSVRWRGDALIGAGVAVVFTLIQFLFIIPGTGGAARSDIAANAAQIGTSVWGVSGFIVLAWTGAFSEELFFRGHFFMSLMNLLGGTGLAMGGSALATIALFAAGHGYQGWAGVVDTGFYGGLTLTLLYIWRGRLTACIVAHALWNTLATIAIFLWY